MPVSFTAAEAILALCAATLAGIVLLLFIRVRESGRSLDDMAEILDDVRDGVRDTADRRERETRLQMEALAVLREELRASTRESREELGAALSGQGHVLSSRLSEIAMLQKGQLETFTNQLARLTDSNTAKLDGIRDMVDNRLGELNAKNEARLDQIRAVVDEKLNATLEQRLGEAFRSVADRLERVHQGLGEMRVLAADVGDLRKVLSNVKTRGTWGEIQLGALLEQILAPEQYAVNVSTRPNSRERVEFAIRLPGQGDEPVWLPIDSKFPQEDYLRLLAALDAGDPEGARCCRNQLEKRIVAEARSIREKYIEPPYTTDFGILFLPVEGLYAEVLRIDGLCETLMRESRIVVAGPTTVAARLNSLQTGFRTLAIQKRSAEVWMLLGQVKTEFGAFAAVLEKTLRKIQEAGDSLEGAARKSRAIERKLRTMEVYPDLETAPEEPAVPPAPAEPRGTLS